MWFQISAPGRAPQRIDAPNWLAALGLALDRTGQIGALGRLACEVLPNGGVIARDARSGLAFIVHADGDDLPDDRLQPSRSADGIELEAGTAELHSGEGEDELSGEFPTVVTRVARDPALRAERLRTAWAWAGISLADIRDAPGEEAACLAARRLAQAAVPTRAGAVLLREPGGGLRFAAASGPSSARLAGLRLPPGRGIAGFCVDRGVALALRRPREDPRFYAEIDRLTGFSTDAVLCAPVGDPALGCLQLLNPEAGELGDEALRLVEPVCAELAARLALDEPTARW